MYGHAYLALNRCLLLTAVSMLVVYLGCAQAQEAEFPGRAIYSTVKTLDIKKLHANLDSVHLVDVRSAFEYGTLHIEGAHHIALYDPAFDEKVRALKAKENKPIVFYCNGHTSYKSYKAADKAMGAKISDAYSYDGGTLDWAKAYPDRAVLLGRTPVDPARLISDDKLKAHQLAPEEFARRVHSTKAAVLDVREALQRAEFSLFPHRQQDIALDDTKRLKAFLNNVRKQRRQLLVYDETGRQAQWLQYYLEDLGLSNYYFMRGGTKAFEKEVLMAGR